MIHYGFWRSSAAYRTRIALNLKGIEAENRYIDLGKQEQDAGDYGAVNPQRLVPSLDDDGVIVNQSLAIMEYLEETHPEPPLLPADAPGRARVRALCLNIACEVHPILTARAMGTLDSMFGVSAAARREWYAHWIARGLTAFEARLTNDPATGLYCHGDAPTMADVCMVPQLNNARTNECDLSGYPTMLRIEETCKALDAFRLAEPSNQPDYTG